MATEAKFLNISEVATRLGVGVRTVYALVSAGKLRYHRIGVGKGRIRISQLQLDEYIDSSIAGPAPAAARAPAPPKLKLRHIRLP